MCPIKSVRDVSEHCVRYVPGPYTPEGEGTDWGILSIISSLFAARQRSVEDGAAPSTEAWLRLELILDAALQCSSPAQGEGQHVAQRVIRRVAVLGLDAVAEDHYARLFTDLRHPIEVTTH